MPQEQNKKLYILWWIVLWVILIIFFFIRRIVSDWQSQKFVENTVQPVFQLSQEYQSWYQEYMSLTWFSVQLPQRVKESDYQIISKKLLNLWVKKVSTWEVVSDKKIELMRLDKMIKQDVDYWIVSQEYQTYQSLFFLPWWVDYPVVYVSKSIQLPSIINVQQLQTNELENESCWKFYLPVWALDKSIYQKSIDFYPWFLDITRLLLSQTWLVWMFSQQKSAQDFNALSALIKKNLTPTCWLPCLIHKNMICWSLMMGSQVSIQNESGTYAYAQWLPWYLYGWKSSVPLWKNVVDELYNAWVYFWLHPVTNVLSDEKDDLYDSSGWLFIGWLTWSNQ